MNPRDMTPEQVADYLATLRNKPLKKKPKKITKKKAKAHAKAKTPKAPRDDSQDMVPVSLRGRHNINGVLYGPGTLTVPRFLANQLSQQDQVASLYDDTWQRERAVMIGPARSPAGGHALTEVHPSFFQQDELRHPEADVASGDTQNVTRDPATGHLNWTN